MAHEERESVALWMMGHGYATGHGDTLNDLLTELVLQVGQKWRPIEGADQQLKQEGNRE